MPTTNIAAGVPDAHSEPEWRPIVGFPKYIINENGSIKRRSLGGSGATPCLKYGFSRRGEPVVGLRVHGLPNKRRMMVALHVLQSFVSDRPGPLYAIGYRDGDKKNVRLSNLFWEEIQLPMWSDGMEWRTIIGFPDYHIREDGAIRRATWGSSGQKPGDAITPTLHPKLGYYYALLSNCGLVKRDGLHELVAHAFLGEPPSERCEVAHNDGVRTHNHVSNLRWSTHSSNMLDRNIHGTDARGAKHWNARLAEADVLDIKRELASGVRPSQVARRRGLKPANVLKINAGLRWSSVAPEPLA